jgi:hypothetical protein
MKVRGKARAVVCLPSQFGILEEDWWTFYVLLGFEDVSIRYCNYATKFSSPELVLVHKKLRQA